MYYQREPIRTVSPEPELLFLLFLDLLFRPSITIIMSSHAEELDETKSGLQEAFEKGHQALQAHDGRGEEGESAEEVAESEENAKEDDEEGYRAATKIPTR